MRARAPASTASKPLASPGGAAPGQRLVRAEVPRDTRLGLARRALRLLARLAGKVVDGNDRSEALLPQAKLAPRFGLGPLVEAREQRVERVAALAIGSRAIEQFHPFALQFRDLPRQLHEVGTAACGGLFGAHRLPVGQPRLPSRDLALHVDA